VGVIATTRVCVERAGEKKKRNSFRTLTTEEVHNESERKNVYIAACVTYVCVSSRTNSGVPIPRIPPSEPMNMFKLVVVVVVVDRVVLVRGG
jgi:hypothetical protein